MVKRGRKFPGLYTQTEDAEAQTKTWAEQQAMALMAVEQLRTLATAPQHRDLLPYSPAWIGEPSEPAEPVLLWHASPFGSQDASPIPDPQDGPSPVAPFPQPGPKLIGK